jgi:hypothetical protein
MHLIDRSIRFVRGLQAFLLIHGLEERLSGCAIWHTALPAPNIAGTCRNLPGIAVAPTILNVTNWYGLVRQREKTHQSLRQRYETIVVGRPIDGSAPRASLCCRTFP